jgi:hypothetical protein
MTTISITKTINDGDLGDGWIDNTDAAYAYADFISKKWAADLTAFADQGHKIEIDVIVNEETSGYTPETDIYIADTTENTDEIKLIDEIKSALTDGDLLWDQFCGSAQASALI